MCINISNEDIIIINNNEKCVMCSNIININILILLVLLLLILKILLVM